MPVVVLFEAPYARGGEVAGRWARESGFHLVTSDDLLSTAERAYGCQKAKLERAMAGTISVFNAFTHERERAIACLRAAVSSLFSRDNWVYCGHATLLVPSSINIALRVCLVAPSSYRAKVAAGQHGIPLAKAERIVARDDAQQATWSTDVAESAPWNPELFDVVVPMHETGIDGAIALIREHAGNPALTPTDGTSAAIADFRLAAAVHMTLAAHGHDVDVRCEHGYITVILNRYTVRLEHLEEDVRRLARTVDGVREVTTRVGPRFRPPSQYVDLDADTPAKILLVDDEREFVQTLSERLLARNVGTAVAFSGEEALAIIESDEPEVVVLDLQMPGIDGIEVLRRVKKGHPATQVIILTGHGSDRERQLAAELGACAYLHKPVDINVLSRTMKDAYAALRRARAETGEPSERG